jgi:hypothetical protein
VGAVSRRLNPRREKEEEEENGWAGEASGSGLGAGGGCSRGSVLHLPTRSIGRPRLSKVEIQRRLLHASVVASVHAVTIKLNALGTCLHDCCTSVCNPWKEVNTNANSANNN